MLRYPACTFKWFNQWGIKMIGWVIQCYDQLRLSSISFAFKTGKHSPFVFDNDVY